MCESNSSSSTGQRTDVCSNVLRSIPEFRGKARVVDAVARFSVLAGRQRVSCSIGNNATIQIDLADRIERQMWGGTYEPHVQRVLRYLLNPGDVFLDVGAHIGYHAALASVLVGHAGRVIAFEADPVNFLRLRQNLCPFSWASAFNKAVWRATGNAGFERSSRPAESGWGTLTDVRDLRKGDHLVVEAISLDEWFSETMLKVSLMKVDAEGSEVGILRGAGNFLRKIRPIIIIEANDVVLRQAQTSALELADILREYSFEIFELDSKHLQKLPAGEAPSRNELLVLPKESTERELAKLQIPRKSTSTRPVGSVRQ